MFSGLGVIASPSLAAAQSVAIVNEASLPRLDTNGTLMPKRPLDLRPEAINRQDCLDDQRVRFTLMLAEFEANAVLQVWAATDGVDCAPQSARSGPSATCWELAPNVPLAATSTVDLPVRRILSGAPPAAPSAPVDDASICGKVDLTALGVHFLYFAPGNPSTAAVTKKVSIAADTIGPAAVVLGGVEPASGGVRLSWPAPGGVSAFSAMNVYCAPAPAADTCAAPDLAPGTAPTPAAQRGLLCATVLGNTSTGTVVSDRPAGERHAFAVAAVDMFGNVGALSSVACATPAPRAPPSEDDAGGGCSMTRRPARVGVFGASAVVAALAAALVSIEAVIRNRRRARRGGGRGHERDA